VCHAACCYARGNKGWVSDPGGISWETFHTFGENTVYRNDIAPRPAAAKPLDSDARRPRPDQCPLPGFEIVVALKSPTDDLTMANREYHVLFLCTGNSARSIMAECAINRWGKGKLRGFSAGSHPKGVVHPLTLELLTELHYETKALRSKSWDEFAAPDSPSLDFVFTVCDQAAAEQCPFWPGRPITAHWGVADPAAYKGSDDEQRRFFFRIYCELENRIKIFTSLRIDALESFALQQRVKEIGRIKLPEGRER
jgi:protein-tyrosine-phosphatase